MYAPEHWSGSCRTCRTGSYGPAFTTDCSAVQAGDYW